VSEVAPPFGEQLGQAEALGVRLQRLPLHAQDERLGLLEALVEHAVDVAGHPRDHGARGAQAIANLIRESRLRRQQRNFNDHAATIASSPSGKPV
jgi:hypothetical protein